MTDSAEQPEDLHTAIAGELEKLRRLPFELLHVLGRNGITRVKRIGDHSYEIKAWSQPVAAPLDSFVVLVGALESGSSSPTHLRGFLVKPGQPHTDLSREALQSQYEP